MRRLRLAVVLLAAWLAARIAELGASGDRPSHLPYRSVDLWRLVIDSAARPSNEHARINAVLAQADGLQRMPPALMRWARTVPTWHSTWSRAVDKVQPDLDRIIEAWAHSDVTHGDRANENASDRISRARSDFRSHSPTALARVPAQ